MMEAGHGQRGSRSMRLVGVVSAGGAKNRPVEVVVTVDSLGAWELRWSELDGSGRTTLATGSERTIREILQRIVGQTGSTDLHHLLPAVDVDQLAG